MAKLKKLLARYLALPLFVLITVFTRPYYFADSGEYAQTILQSEHHENAPLYLESSHVLWRPIGRAVHSALTPVLHDIFPNAPFAQVSVSLILIVFLLSFIGIFYLYKLLRVLPISERAVHITAILYVGSQCVMNYSQTGTSYLAGLSILIVGLYYVLAAAPDFRAVRLFLPALLLAIAPLLWITYVLALPAAIMAYPVMYGWNRKNIYASIELSIFTGLFAFIILVPVFLQLHILSPRCIALWILRPGQFHYAAGPLRMFFGFPKLLFDLGTDGLYFKRYLFRDPYHPVSLFSLLALGTWKITLFYVTLIAVLVAIWRKPSKRKYLAFLILGIVPNLMLSVRWDGAALERHLPLAIYFFLAFALAFEFASRKVRWFFVATTILTVFVNVSAMWYASADATESEVSGKINELWPMLHLGSIVTVLNIQNDLAVFKSIHPFDRFNQSALFQPYPLLSGNPAILGNPDSAKNWTEQFEQAASGSWKHGGTVWVSKSLLEDTPQLTDYWIEGEKPGISWKDISHYFRRQHYSDSTKDFLLLERLSF